MFQENFKNKFQGCFKNVSMKVFLQYLSRMYLIAATRAEGGLVSFDYPDTPDDYLGHLGGCLYNPDDYLYFTSDYPAHLGAILS